MLILCAYKYIPISVSRPVVGKLFHRHSGSSYVLIFWFISFKNDIQRNSQFVVK